MVFFQLLQNKPVRNKSQNVGRAEKDQDADQMVRLAAKGRAQSYKFLFAGVECFNQDGYAHEEQYAQGSETVRHLVGYLL